ncbi:MAG: hybrid sensor histidine kinase/response regulator [Prevotellaceae bacterium]|nr:hybrid sensor histidine kinase/response regulator [Prevotellaceae bacterium]
MTRISVPLKVTLGYVFFMAVLAFAVWLVYGNTKAFMQLDESESRFIKRRNVVDSLVYSIFELNNSERAVCLGMQEEWDTFDKSLARTVRHTDSLRVLIADKRQRAKIDTLVTLLALKRENALIIMNEIAESNSDRFYRKKVEKLHAGQDSVVIHPKGIEVKENKETVYNVVQTRKNFFARLADAFRKQRIDTVSVTQSSHKTEADSVKHSIDIADTIADVLAEIKRQETIAKKEHLKGLAAKERQQQLVSIELARRIHQLVGEIRSDEHYAMQEVLDNDVSARKGIMIKIISLALIAVLSSFVLLYYIWRDMRKAKIYRENLERAKAETERIMAQRERLLLTITHDIKAPAASISGFIELLDGYVDGQKGKGYLRNMANSASHLLSLVGSLLDYHRLESGKVEVQQISFSPSRLVESCAESMKPQATAKGLRLMCDTSACRQGVFLGDSFRIKQILDNLTGNAVKYTRQGEIRITATIKGNWLAVDVADTGCGMTAEESGRIFNAFTRLPDSQGTEGVGLGLSITKELVALLKGEISVESVKGKGTTFHVALPVTPSHKLLPDNTDETAIRDNKGTRATEHGIVILDDDKLQLQLLKEMLARVSEEKWHISLCSHVDEAIRLVEDTRPSVLFIDIEMPEMNGIDVIRQIRDRNGLSIIAMTAHEPSIEPKLIEAGFDACLFKPFNIRLLAETLCHVLNGNISCDIDMQCLAVSKTVEETSSTQQHDKPDRFAPLLAFADGDKEASDEILSNFRTELSGHIESLASAMSAHDRKTISHISHKALPLLDMIGSKVTEQLKALSPERIEMVNDVVLKRYCNEVMEEMKQIVNDLDAIRDS